MNKKKSQTGGNKKENGTVRRMVRIPDPLAEVIDHHRDAFKQQHGVNLSFNAAVVSLLHEALTQRT